MSNYWSRTGGLRKKSLSRGKEQFVSADMNADKTLVWFARRSSTEHTHLADHLLYRVVAARGLTHLRPLELFHKTNVIWNKDTFQNNTLVISF